MIKPFLRERASWILLILFTNLFTLFIAYIDPSIPLSSVLYIVSLSLLLFLLFLILRYPREIRFYKSLVERDKDLDLTSIASPESPFERIIDESIASQTKLLKQAAADNLLLIEQEKDDLLAWIHEVKTPLTAMHLMIERTPDDEMKKHLTYEWLRIHLLLDQQLHQRRIPFIENDLYMEQIDLEALIFSEIKTLQSWCIQKGIGFELNLAVAEVLSDAKWLSFILRQVLTNAVKYSEASDITVNTYLQEEHVLLEVKDQGRGIAPKDLPRIFDKGFTSTTVHRDNGATGMGLYLAKKAAGSLLITIAVQSEVGSGSTFTLTFPLKNEFVKITSV